MAARDYARLHVLAERRGLGPRHQRRADAAAPKATQAARNYADPSWRAEGLAFIASSLRSLLAGAPAGSDHQLAYVRAFATVATSAQDLEFLAGLLDGTVALDGLAVDTDLRWALLRRLVSRGVRAAKRRSLTRNCRATPPTPTSGMRQAAGRRSRRSAPSARPGRR